MKKRTSALAACLLAANTAHADNDTMVIIGSQQDKLTTPGSATVIGSEQLEKWQYTDINRILRQAPGVNIGEEEGFGLRPNIGIRGSGSERSSRISLYEDGVLIAPAPYASPSAYYFPTAGRMAGIEILKGPASVKWGPNTAGGAINLISTPIPEQNETRINLEYGSDNTRRTHVRTGGQKDAWGWLLESHLFSSDGFKDIENSSETTGFDKEDWMAKLRWAPEDSDHSLEFKYQYATEISNQSYLGLTNGDFDDNANRRYGLSALDEFDGQHNQFMVTHIFDISETLTLTTKAYYNEFNRNWFKTEGLDADGSPDAASLSRTSWTNVIDAINTGGSIGGLSATQLQGILNGTVDTAPGSIELRANNRDYYSKGIDSRLVIDVNAHRIELGARYHEDEEDRFQRDSSYQQINGRLVLNDAGEWGNAGDREEIARAITLFAEDRIALNDQWTLIPGVRYEHVDRSRLNNDGRNNAIEALLPSLGVTYQPNESWVFLAGLHEGLTVPGSTNGDDPEESINAELGFRHIQPNSLIEVIAFYSDYENLLGTCTASTGGDCTVGDNFNAGEAKVQGLEVSGQYLFALANNASIPVSFQYTYTDGEFDSSFSSDFFGTVESGDELPDIPEHQFQVSVGYEKDNWSTALLINHSDGVCILGGTSNCSGNNETDSNTTLDITGRVQLNDTVALYGRVENVTDEADIIARQPYGARVNRPVSGIVGVEILL